MSTRLLLATPLPPNTPGTHATSTGSSSFSASICVAEREVLSLEFVDGLRLLWLAHMAQVEILKSTIPLTLQNVLKLDELTIALTFDNSSDGWEFLENYFMN